MDRPLSLKRRPEDLSIWHARLDWAVATNQVPAAEKPSSTYPRLNGIRHKSRSCRPGSPPRRAIWKRNERPWSN